jgi:predicted ABC-type transport system involved in lysophospholipase L1 biosynthesis ATPase subunit
MMPALIGGFNKKQAGEKACKLLQEVGLESRITHKPENFRGRTTKGGHCPRPDHGAGHLLVDEPTGNLDTETGKKIEDIWST